MNGQRSGRIHLEVARGTPELGSRAQSLPDRLGRPTNLSNGVRSDWLCSGYLGLPTHRLSNPICPNFPVYDLAPGLLISPLAGALVDRWERRQTMLLSDGIAGVCTLVVALLLLADQLEIWQIYLATAVISICSEFQWLAYSAATTLLVLSHQLGRAAGIVQLAEAAARIVAPFLAGVLLVLVDFVENYD